MGEFKTNNILLNLQHEASDYGVWGNVRYWCVWIFRVIYALAHLRFCDTH